MNREIRPISFPGWEIISIDGQDFQVDFRHKGWQQTEKRCEICNTLLETTDLDEVINIKNNQTKHSINLESLEAQSVIAKLIAYLSMGCINCRQKQKGKKIAKQKRPCSSTYVFKGFWF